MDLLAGGVLVLLCSRKNKSSKQVEEPSAHIYENAETLWAIQVNKPSTVTDRTDTVSFNLALQIFF